MATDSAKVSDYGDVGVFLQDATILLTGAVGFAGTALLFRLLEDPILRSSVKQVLALIRGETLEKAVARLPRPLQRWTRVDGSEGLPKLVVLNGDCSKIGLGLVGEQAEAARRASIVIHAAGDTRFNLSQAEAIQCIVRPGISYPVLRSILSR